MNRNCKLRTQQGVALLEALISILVFSLGILGLVGLQALAIKNTTDAKYRADASFLANQVIAQMWADRANLAQYAHRPGGALCAPTGGNSALAAAQTWLAEVNRVLPGAAADKQQITVDAATGQVTVTVCWRANQENSDHNHIVSAQIRAN